MESQQMSRADSNPPSADYTGLSDEERVNSGETGGHNQPTDKVSRVSGASEAQVSAEDSAKAPTHEVGHRA